MTPNGRRAAAATMMSGSCSTSSLRLDLGDDADLDHRAFSQIRYDCVA